MSYLSNKLIIVVIVLIIKGYIVRIDSPKYVIDLHVLFFHKMF